MFIKHNSSRKLTTLIVYVDDIIVAGNDEGEIQRLKTYLSNEFEIKDLRSLKYFLVIEVACSKGGIFISQQRYILDLLREIGMLGCKPAETPIEQNNKLGGKIEDDMVDRGLYQRLVGKFIYLSHTQPDIAYAIGVVSQFMHSPHESHMEAIYRTFRYLKSTPGKEILFQKTGNIELGAYNDADLAGSIVDRRSTYGYCTFLGGNLVKWRSKKQLMVARSSAEAKFRVMTQGICELL